MGRRGLSRKVRRADAPSPEALAFYLHVWTWELYKARPDDLLPPFTPAGLFGAPDDKMAIELEVGCGTGEFLCALAAARPDTGFVGVDPSTKSLYFAVRMAEVQGLRNIRFVRAPVVAIYPQLVDEALSAVYVHFPDPFVRARGKHKVLNEAFLEHAHAALRTGGLLSVVSDNAELFEEALALVEQDSGGWAPAHAERFLRGFEPPVKSRYQQKWERHGIEGLRFEMRRQPRPAARKQQQQASG